VLVKSASTSLSVLCSAASVIDPDCSCWLADGLTCCCPSVDELCRAQSLPQKHYVWSSPLPYCCWGCTWR
jgi:hypothetical protein